MNVPDTIETFVDQIDYTLTVVSYSNDGINTTIIFEDIYHASIRLMLNVNSVDYKIILVNGNSITIKGVIDPVNTVKIQKPFYYHGTPRATNNEINLMQENRVAHTPFIYLLQILRERVNNDPKLSLDRIADVRMFFLDEADFTNWNTDNHYTFVINRMRSLVENLFIKEANDYYLFDDFDDYEVIDHVKFGVYKDYEGHVNSVFDKNLSGVELRINLPILKSLSCQT